MKNAAYIDGKINTAVNGGSLRAVPLARHEDHRAVLWRLYAMPALVPVTPLHKLRDSYLAAGVLNDRRQSAPEYVGLGTAHQFPTVKAGVAVWLADVGCDECGGGH
ncbi:hypothetical protein [Bosea sp. AS-1]|uniref:hypothetical protein n=1 Tax=Bosea sp. AS-1 TaxID=2015316 RepID=UPI0012FDD370|nr:hypothetical protein [Bosea sp. AS-1]